MWGRCQRAVRRLGDKKEKTRRGRRRRRRTEATASL